MYFPIVYQAIHRVLEPVFPGCLWSGIRESAAIALTFDDGPHPQYTLQLLSVLKKYSVPASLFWLGAHVQQSPEVARAVYEEGHWIGLHGYDHHPFIQYEGEHSPK